MRRFFFGTECNQVHVARLKFPELGPQDVGDCMSPQTFQPTSPPDGLRSPSVSLHFLIQPGFLQTSECICLRFLEIISVYFRKS